MQDNRKVSESDGSKACSECGRKFYIPCVGTWMYKTHRGRSNSVDYQCSYTCYDHAKLRSDKVKKSVSKENYRKYVKQSESVMRAQGKEVLHQISLTKSEKDGKK